MIEGREHSYFHTTVSESVQWDWKKLQKLYKKPPLQVNIWIRSHSLQSNSTNCDGVCYVH